VTSHRDIRDVLADAMRIERLGFAVKPSWREWAAFDPEGCEAVRRRADHLIRLLASAGVTLAVNGDPAPAEASPDIWRFPVGDGRSERVLRRAENEWHLVLIADGKETVLMQFTLDEAHVIGGRVLLGDRAVLSEQGATTKIAAALEIMRVHAR
jgi:hypothetical protein